MEIKKISENKAETLINTGYAGYMNGVNAGNVDREYIVVDFDFGESNFVFKNKSEYWEENEGKVRFLAITELVISMEQVKEVV